VNDSPNPHGKRVEWGETKSVEEERVETQPSNLLDLRLYDRREVNCVLLIKDHLFSKARGKKIL